MSDASTAISTVHEMRRLWKPHKQRLQAAQKDHPTTIRFHRACSWLQRVESIDDDLDFALVGQWIAFNALYNQWDDRMREPAPDRASWRRFLARIVALDRGERVAAMLDAHRKLVLAILDDAYLAGFFWRDPSPARALQTTRDRRQASQWYAAGRHGVILETVVESIYLQRCQLVHGTATHNSRLNRGSLRRCTTMLGHLLPAMLLVMIEHGADEDWGVMCYPPMG